MRTQVVFFNKNEVLELASLLKESTKCPKNFSGNFRCTDLAKIPPNSWSGTTKCPEKLSAVLSVMSLMDKMYRQYKKRFERIHER